MKKVHPTLTRQNHTEYSESELLTKDYSSKTEIKLENELFKKKLCSEGFNENVKEC